jgi:hypothetical protein
VAEVAIEAEVAQELKAKKVPKVAKEREELIELRHTDQKVKRE